MNICLFKPVEINKPLPLRDERAEHLVKVLHKKCGDSFFAGVVGGEAGTATITRLGTKYDADGGTIDFVFVADTDLQVEVTSQIEIHSQSAGVLQNAFDSLVRAARDRSKPLLPITLIVGFPRPIQLRRLLRDVAGIGCAEVHLTGTELGDKNYMKSTLVERGAAEQMLWDGTVQAGSTHVPRLQMHKTLAECLDAVASGSAYASAGTSASAAGLEGANPAASENPAFSEPHLLAALDNVRPACSLLAFLRKASAVSVDASVIVDSSASVAGLAGANPAASKCTDASESNRHIVLAIGSERGWTERERDLLCERGFTLCGMGERILRTETAATAACAIVAAEINSYKIGCERFIKNAN